MHDWFTEWSYGFILHSSFEGTVVDESCPLYSNLIHVTEDWNEHLYCSDDVIDDINVHSSAVIYRLQRYLWYICTANTACCTYRVVLWITRLNLQALCKINFSINCCELVSCKPFIIVKTMKFDNHETMVIKILYLAIWNSETEKKKKPLRD